MKKVRVTITVDPDVERRIKELSEKESRSFSQQVNKILKDYLDKEEGK